MPVSWETVYHGARSKSLFRAKQAYHSGAFPCVFRSSRVFLVCSLPFSARFAVCGGAFAQSSCNAAAGHLHRRSGSPEHDGPVGHQGAAPWAERQRECAQPRQLRRVAGQSLSQRSRPAHDERRPEGDDGEDVVGPAPAGVGGDVLEVCLRARSQRMCPRSPGP